MRPLPKTLIISITSGRSPKIVRVPVKSSLEYGKVWAGKVMGHEWKGMWRSFNQDSLLNSFHFQDSRGCCICFVANNNIRNTCLK